MIVNTETIALHKYIVQIAEAFQKVLEMVSQSQAKSYLMISFLWNSSQQFKQHFFSHVFTLYVGLCVCVSVYVGGGGGGVIAPAQMWRSETTYRSRFFPSIVWPPGTEPRLLGLVANAVALRAIWWALQTTMFKIRHSNLVKFKDRLVWHVHVEEWWQKKC